MKMAFVARDKCQINNIVSQLRAMHRGTVTTHIDEVRDGDIFVCLSFEQKEGWHVVLDVVPDKQDAIILDHSDTHLRLGFVTDIDSQYDTLCDGNPKPKADSKKEILPKECGKCHFLKPPKMQICPACGFKAEPVNKTETADGDLSELHQKKANKTMTNSQKEVFFAELRRYGMDRGYKEGWASNKYREKTGVWPNKINHIAPRQPSMETLSFIQHLNIKAAYRGKPKKEKKIDPFPIDKAAVAAMERRKREAAEIALKELKIWVGGEE